MQFNKVVLLINLRPQNSLFSDVVKGGCEGVALCISQPFIHPLQFLKIS